jgi:RNA polymerase subunit RPABC4/transcription elongation factor Spt4
MSDTITCANCQRTIPVMSTWCPVCESKIIPKTDEELLQEAHVIKPFKGLIPKKVAQK